jgi:predicted metal-dependent hydrolase
MPQRKPSLPAWMGGTRPAQLASRERCDIDGATIEYTLKRSQRRRSISLTIDQDGLRIGAPWRASQSRIDSVVLSHAGWIVRKLGEWQTRRPPPFTWQSGVTVMTLGEPLTVVADESLTMTTRDGRRLLVAASENDAGALAQRVVGWLQTNALDWFEQRVRHFAPVLGVSVPRIRLSNARTRWGTCYPEGRVLLNWRLIHMPPALIDYVVVHELAHLREPNHSVRFWSWVASILPDYKERRLILRREGHRYLLA